MKKTILCSIISVFLVIQGFAGSVTLTWGGNTVTIDGLSDDLVEIISDNQDAIEQALADNGVSQTDVESYVDEAKKAYDDFVGSTDIATATPYTTAKKGLNDFSGVLVDVLPNSQLQQNVWANSWIGFLIPNVRFGLGLNAGVSSLNLSPIIKTGEALGISMGGLPETLVWPTATVDFRVGGFFLPFDVGFTFSVFDTSKISAIDNAINPAAFDFFTIGGDIRYAVLKGGHFIPTISAGLGLYHTRANFAMKNDTAEASLGVKATTLVLNSQASLKLAFFVPFAGLRVALSSSSADWSAKVNWASLLDTKDSAIAEAVKYGILPNTFSGGSSSNMFQHIRPMIYGGFAFDIAVIDLTFSASYDFISQIGSVAFSLRFALN